MRRSADGGVTWPDASEVAMSQPGSMLVQPAVVRLPSGNASSAAAGPAGGRLLALFRSRRMDKIYAAESADADGRKWGPPRPTKLPNNNSAIQVRSHVRNHTGVTKRACVDRSFGSALTADGDVGKHPKRHTAVVEALSSRRDVNITPR
eukprot:2677809-Pyramimonas_sp.AAC.2